MTFLLKHPFTLIVSGPKSSGVSNFVKRILVCRKQLCDIAFEYIMCCRSENNAPHHLKSVSLLQEVPDFEKPQKYDYA